MNWFPPRHPTEDEIARLPRHRYWWALRLAGIALVLVPWQWMGSPSLSGIAIQLFIALGWIALVLSTKRPVLWLGFSIFMIGVVAWPAFAPDAPSRPSDMPTFFWAIGLMIGFGFWLAVYSPALDRRATESQALVRSDAHVLHASRADPPVHSQRLPEPRLMLPSAGSSIEQPPQAD